jgi:FKBP-type peptidyl-prolyl cis-trans isomerase
VFGWKLDSRRLQNRSVICLSEAALTNFRDIVSSSNRVATCDRDGSVRDFDLETLSLCACFKADTDFGGSRLHISPKGIFVATASYDNARAVVPVFDGGRNLGKLGVLAVSPIALVPARHGPERQEVMIGAEGLPGMRTGGSRTVVVPPDLIYHEKEVFTDLPENAMPVYDLTLLSVGDQWDPEMEHRLLPIADRIDE